MKYLNERIIHTVKFLHIDLFRNDLMDVANAKIAAMALNSSQLFHNFIILKK